MWAPLQDDHRYLMELIGVGLLALTFRLGIWNSKHFLSNGLESLKYIYFIKILIFMYFIVNRAIKSKLVWIRAKSEYVSKLTIDRFRVQFWVLKHLSQLQHGPLFVWLECFNFLLIFATFLNNFVNYIQLMLGLSMSFFLGDYSLTKLQNLILCFDNLCILMFTPFSSSLVLNRLMWRCLFELATLKEISHLILL